MRPAWLPSQPPTTPPHPQSHRDAYAEESTTRPRSAAAVASARPSTTPPRDAMVNSARQLLFPDTSSSSCDAFEAPFLSLRDYMDSFPLVPLAVIPRFSFQDLSQCEAGLLKLYATLAVETNADDAQLGKYIARQLGVVQRHMEQARAKERVLQLLSGEPSFSSSSTSKPLPVFLQSTNANSVDGVRRSGPLETGKTTVSGGSALLAPAKSTGSLLPMKTKKQDQLMRAKAMVKANAVATTTTTAPYVITTSESSLKARAKKNRLLKKKTQQQVDDERVAQQEKEKQSRRQAAYQRLMARQELQATKNKKKQHAAAVQGETKTTMDKPGEANDAGSFVQVTPPPPRNGSGSDSDSDSDASEVSNCSETDAADETAIMAMRVAVAETTPPEVLEESGYATPVAVDDDEEGDEEDTENEKDGSDVRSPERGSDETKAAENGVEEDEDEQSDCDDADDDDARVETHGGDMEEERNDGGAAQKNNEPEQQHAHAHDLDESDGSDAAEKESVAFSNNHDDDDQDRATAHTEEAQENDETEATREQNTRDEIAHQLQLFIAERKQFALHELARHAQEQRRLMREVAAANDDATTTATTTTTASTSLFEPQQDDRPMAHATTIVAVALPPATGDKNKKVKTKPKRSSSSCLLPQVARAIGHETVDYRSYFANFFCILTSVFEQQRTLAQALGSHSHSSLPTTTTTTSNTTATATGSHHPMILGDHHALRMQLKLYQSWQSIMDDYATVFGKTSTAPNTSPTLSATTAHYRINSATRKEVCDIVVTALEKLGHWDEHPSGLGLKTTWNLLWTWSKPNVERKTLLAWQKVNHFQHAKALTRKDCLKKSISKYLSIGGRLKQAYDIVPASFLLPQEYVVFVQAFQDRGKQVSTGKNIWIMKPVALSRGRGISLVNDLSQVVYGEQVVIQEYIANPLLLDGFKFDLRLYVLVTSFNPLEAFFYEQGFVRMCTKAYEDGDLNNLFIHLTNSSIQKENLDEISRNPANPCNNTTTDQDEDDPVGAGGSKIKLAYLWKRLDAMGADVPAVKKEIFNVILKALVCGEDHIPFQVNSFDLYGYDVLLDTNFRPWLIEINSSPSMARENDLDFQVKDALIYDTLRLVNPLHFDRQKLVEILGRRFVEAENGKKRPHANTSTRHPREVEELSVRQMNADLSEILGGQVPRLYGEMPEHMGSYTRLAPHTTIYNQLIKLKKSCLRLDRK